MTIHSLRRNYLYGSLQRQHLSPDPIEQFRKWFEELKQAEVPDWFEINAMSLATVDAQGIVSNRIVLLKAIDHSGFTFFTNYLSHKSAQLAENPHAALVFFWPMLERQVRVEGTVTKTESALSDEYFYSRPVTSRLGAWVSMQSSVIADDEHLEWRVEELHKQYPDDQIPRPEHWGGYRLMPSKVEFWQGKPSRLHDRFCYTREGSAWSIHRLAP